MQKETVFSMKLESDLRASFMAEAEAAHRPASQILRDLMREFIQRQKNAREYEEFLRQKVELARDQIHSGLVISNNEVEADFSARRSAKKKKL
jgi:predicted transcriptional regulator